MADTTNNPFSRYFQTRRVVTEEGERYAEWRPPAYGVLPERLYVVTDADVDRPDIIARKTLGDDRQWWLIMHYNRIQDPMSLESGDKLRIPLYRIPPTRSPAEVLLDEAATAPAPERQRVAPVPPFRAETVLSVARAQPGPSLEEDGAVPGQAPPSSPGAVAPSPTIVLTFGFPVPPCLSGQAHFQVVASLLPDFSNIVLSKHTQASVLRWYYYDPSASNGSGGYVAFPAAGVDAAALSGQTVYVNIVSGELDPDNEYFFRYRVWYDKPGVGWVETPWYAPPSISLAP